MRRKPKNKNLTFFKKYDIIIIESEGKGMKQKFVPYDKLSKKAKRAIDKQKRSVWDISPVTRTVPDKRRKQKDNEKFDFS